MALSSEEITEYDRVRAAAEKLDAGDVGGAREMMLDYLGSTERRPVELLMHVLRSFIGWTEVAGDTARHWVDESLAAVERDPSTSFHQVFFIVNLARVLIEQKRYAEAVGLCERAFKGGYFSAECYVTITHAALQSRDKKLLARSVKKLDKLTLASAKRVSEKLGTVIPVFANAAEVHLLLGDKSEVIRYIGLAREFRYEGFDQMPNQPALAALEDDPDFRALFAYPVAVRCKTADQPPFWTDGYRVFVDRAWPKEARKNGAKIKEWLHELAPSDALRTSLEAAPASFPRFREGYMKELAAHESTLARLAEKGELTLVHAATDSRRHAEVLAEVLGARMRS